jgi:hypothetical protein
MAEHGALSEIVSLALNDISATNYVAADYLRYSYRTELPEAMDKLGAVLEQFDRIS